MRSERLVLVKNDLDLARLLAVRPELLRRSLPLAASPQASLLLRAAGIEALCLPEFIDRASIPGVYAEARRLSKAWYAPVSQELEYLGISLGSLIENDLLDFFLHATAAEAALRVLVQRLGKVEFYIFPPAGEPCIWSGSCRHSLIEAAIQDAARRGEAGVQLIRCRPLWHPARVWGAARRRARRGPTTAPTEQPPALREEAPSLLWRPNLLRPRAGEQLLLAVGNPQNLRMIFAYTSALENDGRYQVLGANVDDALPPFPERAGLSGDAPYFRLSDVPRTDTEAQGFKHIGAAAKRFSALRARSSAPAVANPYLGFQYDYVFRDLLPRALRTYTAIDVAVEALRPDLVLVAGHGFAEQAAVAAARLHDVSSVLVAHGIVGRITSFDVPADRFWAWGGLSSEVLLEEFRWSSERVRVVGAPQLECAWRPVGQRRSPAGDGGRSPLAARGESPAAFDRRCLPADCVAPRSHTAGIFPRRALSAGRIASLGATLDFHHGLLGLGAGRKLLVVLTSGFGEGPCPSISLPTFVESWEELLRWTERHPEILVVIKPHPCRDMYGWYAALERDSGLQNLSVLRAASLEPLLAVADAALLMQSISTAGLVALGVGCPLLYVVTARTYEYRSEIRWREEEGLTVIRSNGQIGRALDSIMNDPVARQANVSAGARFLERNVASNPGLDTRIRAAIDEALSIRTGRLSTREVALEA